MKMCPGRVASSSSGKQGALPTRSSDFIQSLNPVLWILLRGLLAGSSRHG